MPNKLEKFLEDIDFQDIFERDLKLPKCIVYHELKKFKNKDLTCANQKCLLHLAAYYEDYDFYTKFAELGLDEQYKDRYGFLPFQLSKGRIRYEYESKIGVEGLKKIYDCYKPNSSSARCFYDFLDDIEKTEHHDYYFELLEYLLQHNMIAKEVFEDDNRHIPYKGEYYSCHESESSEGITLSLFSEIKQRLPEELKKDFTLKYLTTSITVQNILIPSIPY